MRKVFGTAVFLTLAVSIWTVAPLIAIGLNVLFRPDYLMRDFRSEYQARLVPNRVRWYEYKAYRIGCADRGERRVVILHTTEFAETPLDFLTRTFPHCSKVTQENDAIPGIFHGIGIGRI